MAGDRIVITDIGISAQPRDKYSQKERYAVIPVEKLSAHSERRVGLFAVYDEKVYNSPKSDRFVSRKHSHNTETFKRDTLTEFLINLPDFTSGEYENAIGAAFLEEDRLLRDEDLRGSRLTVALCLIDVEQGKLVVADEGDSHVVIAKQEEALGGMYGVTVLSRIHKKGTPSRTSRTTGRSAASSRPSISSGAPASSNVDSLIPQPRDKDSASGAISGPSAGAHVALQPQIHERTTSETSDSMNETNRSTNSSPSSYFEANSPYSSYSFPKKSEFVSSNESIRPPHRHTIDLSTTHKALLLLASNGVGEPQKAKDLCEWATIKMEEDGWSANRIAKEAVKQPKRDECSIIVVVIERAGSRSDDAA